MAAGLEKAGRAGGSRRALRLAEPARGRAGSAEAAAAAGGCRGGRRPFSSDGGSRRPQARRRASRCPSLACGSRLGNQRGLGRRLSAGEPGVTGGSRRVALIPSAAQGAAASGRVSLCCRAGVGEPVGFGRGEPELTAGAASSGFAEDLFF